MEERKCLHCKKRLSPCKSAKVLYCSDKCGNLFRGKRWRDLNQNKERERRRVNNSFGEKRIIYRIKSKAKKLGIPFDLTFDDIDIPTHCPVLGIKLRVHMEGKRGYHVNSPSVDRIDPDGGYLKGNIRVISSRANLLKSNATVKELEAVLNDLKKIRQ